MFCNVKIFNVISEAMPFLNKIYCAILLFRGYKVKAVILLPIIKFYICQLIMYMLCDIIRIIPILTCLEFLRGEALPLNLEGKTL